MVRGPRHHLKRLNAPKHWMLDKLGGVWAPRPSTGPHKIRECLPLVVLLRERLKYALTRREAMLILMQRLIQVDAKVRTDVNFPIGYQDVITIEKTGENFRMLLDTKGRYVPKKVSNDEAAFKLCRVKKVARGAKGIPYILTHDGRTIRYPDPNIKPNDTVKIDLSRNQDIDYVHFDVGNVAMTTGGKNIGRIGVVMSREKHPGSFDIIHLRDAAGRDYATRMGNVFILGKGNKPWISLPKGGGVKLTIQQEAQKRLEKR